MSLLGRVINAGSAVVAAWTPVYLYGTNVRRAGGLITAPVGAVIITVATILVLGTPGRPG